MIAIVESYLTEICDAKSEADIADLLARVAKEFEFRSAFLIHHEDDEPAPPDRVIDSDQKRELEWNRLFGGPDNGGTGTVSLSDHGLVVLGRRRFADDQHVLRELWESSDLLDCVLAPIHEGGKIIGLVGFSGIGQLDQVRQTALQVISYDLFAQSHTLRELARAKTPGPITSREKEVLTLSAEGLTSEEIGEKLGVTARTVNQHVDNATRKLRTRNRTHAVAEAIRLGLLGK